MLISEKHARAGFSLVELIFVFAIIASLMAGVMYVYRTVTYQAAVRQTKNNLELIKAQVDLYNMEKDTYPAKLEDLAPTYIQTVPKDGWTNKFGYRVTANAKNPYELYSHGPSGPGAPVEERISVWQK